MQAKNCDLQNEGFWRETNLTNATVIAIGWLRIQTERETETVGPSSKNGNFVTKNRTSVLKIERGVLKIEMALWEGFSTSRGPHCVRQPPNRSNCTQKGRIQSNKTTWVRRAKQRNINFVSSANSGIPTQKSANDPM